MTNNTNLIDTEFEAKKEFSFDTVQHKTKKGEKTVKLVVLSHRNVALAEAMIENDSDYSKGSDIYAGPDRSKNYAGSTAYWMTKLHNDIVDKVSDEELMKSFTEAVKAVDRENSTHLNADKKGIKEMTVRLFSRKETLLDELIDREKGFKLISFLAEKTVPDDQFHHGRVNYSFATKFCHYACLYFFKEGDNKRYRDNYSIYDKVLRDTLPMYLEQAGIKNKNGKAYNKSSFNTVDKYRDYSDAIDLLRKDIISRNGFDQLIWYFHKAR